ncbi:MAG: hypothetical protein ACOH2T_19150 [Pseudomonas sp.]
MDYENQQMLETLFNKHQTSKLIKRELLTSARVIELIQASALSENFCLDLLIAMVLHKRAAPATLVGQLMKHYGQNAQATADALLVAAQEDLVNFDPEKRQFIMVFDLDQATHDLMRQYQYLPPMVVPPLKVTSNRGSGYTTILTDSLILKNNHHEGDLCLDSINRFNAIPLSINRDVVVGIRNNWKHLDKAKPSESFEDYQTRVKAFVRYEKDSFFTIALMREMGNRFHLTHKPDKRGRTYCQGYHVSYQGNSWNKACVEFADKEYIQ